MISSRPEEQLMARRPNVATEFHRHYAASVASAPSRASLFTGHYPTLHGVRATDGAAKAARDPDVYWLDPNTVPTMGHYSRAAGDRTYYRGKWHVSHADLVTPDTHESLASSDDAGAPLFDTTALYAASERLAPHGFSGWIGSRGAAAPTRGARRGRRGGARVAGSDAAVAGVRRASAFDGPVQKPVTTVTHWLVYSLFCVGGLT
ncbi:sulfatase-like hydrolase/transferase [Nannocystis punicea]|uniref:Sulfatase-like hydrolase/transferase n=1 Tax=Nannocystis punicea TaxID=2995304 RepID=A0ABY7H903_9BACT|nr:sulfatase-like hydrolase/transferase [Nannocystis poenicansa]WAS95509.1 sulfatase-like hydrolase/transferase [Nannocystis poenicansa]